MKNIVANNPVSFLSEFTNAIRDGWILNTRDTVLMYPRYETTLVKQNGELPQIVEFKPNDICIYIDGYSFGEVCYKMQYFIQKHWNVNYDSMIVNANGPCLIQMWREEYLAVQNYTKEELQEMGWEKLKLLSRSYNCFNRNKDICIYNILKQQEGK